jgi:hypothetical protein
LPVAYAVHNARICADMRETASVLTDPAFNSAEEVVLSGEFDLNRLAQRKDPESVTVTQYGINSVELAVSLSAPGLVVLTDTFYPGWKAFCDGGKETEIFCANGLFRAVFVPEGQHTVRFVFLPESFVLGVVIAGTTVFLLASWGILVTFKRLKSHNEVDCQKDSVSRKGLVE